jgi:hypothetical protein
MKTALIIDQQELADVLRAIVRDEIAALAPGEEDPWLDAEAAGGYLSMSTSAIQTAWTRGKLVCHLSETGQRRVRRSELDQYAMAGDRA